MGDFIARDASLFLDALICGMIIAGIYDVLRIYRSVIPHLNIIVGLEDFLFFNLSGVYLFAVMFCENNGVVRGFFLVGVIVGAYIYKKSIGEILVRLASDGINYLINILLKKPVNKVIMSIRKQKEKVDGEQAKKCKTKWSAKKFKTSKNEGNNKKKEK